MVAAVAAVPFLLHYLGQERFGVLSLVWVVVGYFSFLDMGLGRAVTVAIATCRANVISGHADELHVVGTACVFLGGVGGAVAVLLGLCIVNFGIPFQLSSLELFEEVTQALLWTLPSLPLLLLSSALRGHLEGVGAFRSLNLLRIPTGLMLIAGPCLTAFYTPSLVWACVSILAVRLVQAVALLFLVAKEMDLPFLHFFRTISNAINRRWLLHLLSFGGWVTVSNIVGPVIVYVDRFVIATILSASAVAIYAVPFDVVSRLPILIGSLCSVLLPELARLSQSASSNRSDEDSAPALVKRASMLSAWLIAGVVTVGYMSAPSVLRLWMGPLFEVQGGLIAQILLMAFGVNALAQIPFTALQAAGRARTVALLHLAELVPYVVLLVWAVTSFGIVGPAWVWLLRSAIDYVVLAWLWSQQATRLGTNIKG
jgi:O-antigen/teichoic acid export membrane protein